LTKEGIAFLHHSNLGNYPHYKFIRSIPKLHGLLGRMRLVERNIHNREMTMSTNLVEQYSAENDLSCISQEMVNWGTKTALIDCFSVICRKQSSISRKNVMLENSYFMEEAMRIRELSRLYEVKP